MTIGVGPSVVNALFEKGVGYKRKGDIHLSIFGHFWLSIIGVGCIL